MGRREYFLKLKNCRKPVTEEERAASLGPADRADVKLNHASSEVLLDVYRSPLVEFHNCERLHQGMPGQEHQDMVDFILLCRQQSDDKSGQNSLNIFTHHACYCRVMSTSPIWWLLNGPLTITHNFAAAFCEIKLTMSVHNSSDFPVSVSVGPADSSASLSSASSASPASDNEVGWHALPQMNDIKVASDIPRAPKTLVSESTAPFIWSGSSWTHFKLEPLSSTEIPLQITVFSPGTYELSNYLLHWSFLSSGDQGDKGDVLRPTGTCEGHPYYITVLPQD